MISVGSEARFRPTCKIFGSAAAVVALTVMTPAPAVADPPTADPGGTAQVAQVVPNPAYNPGYNPFYYMPGTSPSIYNSPF
jgi:hypothetical protein